MELPAVRQSYVRTKLVTAAAGKETYAEYEARWQQIVDECPTVTGCVFCPDLRFEGTARECREWAAAHRLEQHPETLGKQRSKRKRRPFNSTNVTEEQEEAMTADRLRRMRLLGIPS